MIVDPNTGLPVEETAPAAQSAVGMAGQTAIGDPNSLGYRLLGHIPSASTGMAWNMGRGINTVMGGGFNRGRRFGNRFGNQSNWRGSFFNTFSPTRFTSFSDPAGIMADPSKGAYTPFNFLGSQGNKLAQAAATRSMNATNKNYTRTALKTVLGLSSEQEADVDRVFRGISKGDTKVFDGGVLSRLGVSTRLGSMGAQDKLSRRDARRLVKTIHSMDRMKLDISGINGASEILEDSKKMGVWRAGRAAQARGLNPNMARRAGQLMLSSFEGRFTQRAAGWVAGMSPGYGASTNGGQVFMDSYYRSRGNMRAAARTLDIPADRVQKDVLEAGAVRSLRYAGRLAGKGALGAAANMAGRAAIMGGSRAIPFVGTAMLVGDLAGMAFEGIKSAADLAKDAAHSFQGQIQKPIMGMGYKDNAINATSRARGLTAIQSSRLNARNALGHEAGMMAGHFG